MTTREMRVDFCVAGGGISGVCAALAAARAGLKVALIQNRSVLGGNSSSEIRMHIVGADSHGHKPGARETGLMEELRLTDAAHNPQRSFSVWDMMLYDKVISEPGISLLLDTTVVAAESETLEPNSDLPLGPRVPMSSVGPRRRIRQITARRDSTEEIFQVQATFFADCTGDGRLGYEAGADYTEGREASAEYGESFAPPSRDPHRLGSSIMFMAREQAHPVPFHAPAWARKFTEQDFACGRDVFSYEYGYWWFEWGGHLDTISDDSAIRHECWRIALGVWDYVKNSGKHPGAANYALEWIAPITGKRESRRFLGPVILTQADVFSPEAREDAVAYGGWPIDLHPIHGIDSREEPPCTQNHFDHLFSIPYGVYHSRNVENLFFAGRNLSATHVAFAATRVMATCGVGGQAVGAAAALLCQQGSNTCDAISLPVLRARLAKDDCFLPGYSASDPADLVRSARISASSNAPDCEPAILSNGVARALQPSWGPWASDASNLWMAGQPEATLHLEWDHEVCISEIRLTFNTGLERELILSGSDRATSHTLRSAQPECVESYLIQVGDQRIVEEHGNILRHRVHQISPVKTQSLVIRLLKTHGGSPPSLFELRIY
jgi:hypothetical protein